MVEFINTPLPEPVICSPSSPAYRIHIDEDMNCIFAKHYGRLTVDQIYDRYEEIFTDSKNRPNFNYFVDYSKSTNEMLADDIRDLATYLKSKHDFIGDCKHAVLCSSIVGYGYSRMLDSLYNANNLESSSQIQTMIYNAADYTDLEEPIRKALLWLGIPPDYHRPF